jgi:hypothetical protein
MKLTHPKHPHHAAYMAGLSDGGETNPEVNTDGLNADESVAYMAGFNEAIFNMVDYSESVDF